MDPPGEARMFGQPMMFETTDETTSAAAKVEIVEFKQNGKYGRKLTAFGSKMWDTRVVVYRHNSVYREAYPGQNYGVTDWQRRHEHTSVATLREAKALAIEWAREGIAAGYPSR